MLCIKPQTQHLNLHHHRNDIISIKIFQNITKLPYLSARVCLKRDGTRTETRFRLLPKQMSPFKSAGVSVQSTTGSRGVRIGWSNAGYTMFQGSVRVLATHSIRHFPLHFPICVSLCAIRFHTHSTSISQRIMLL